ncbi:MAG TPA: SigE family RNA polymerase sigma factor [Actinocrinis sp.]|nr:SigE family RNA polymerase sigma factor [Actinocrinis sp.]
MRGLREPAGFREYVEARQTSLWRAAYLMVGDAHLAQDLVQIALARAWRNWERVARAEDVDAYVYRILANVFASSWRRRWRGELPSGDALPDPPAGDDGASWEDRMTLLAAVRLLPRRQRAVIALRYYLDQTESQTAQALGCSVGTVKSQAAKALASLRVQLSADPDQAAETTP